MSHPTCSLGELFHEIRNGKNIEQDKSGQGFAVSRIETISSGTVSCDRVGYSSADIGPDDPNWLQPGDLLFSHINSPDRVGQVALYQGEPQPLFHGINLLRLRPDTDLISPNFALYLLRSPAFRRRLQAFVNRAVNQASVSATNLKSIHVSLPPIDEQRRVAAVLGAADALRAQRRLALAKLDALTQAVFVDMFGSPGCNPANHPVVMMVELVNPKRPITYGILKPGDDVPGGVPYVRVVDMTGGSIQAIGIRRTTREISEQYKRSLLKQGDLLLSIRGHVGRVALVDRDVAGANITQDTARLAITGADPVYVLECLRSPALQSWMASFTKGAAVRGINLTDVKRIPIPLPPASAQTRFAEIARLVRHQRQNQVLSGAQLDLLFSSLQNRAFRGER